MSVVGGIFPIQHSFETYNVSKARKPKQVITDRDYRVVVKMSDDVAVLIHE